MKFEPFNRLQTGGELEYGIAKLSGCLTGLSLMNTRTVRVKMCIPRKS